MPTALADVRTVKPDGRIEPMAGSDSLLAMCHPDQDDTRSRSIVGLPIIFPLCIRFQVK
jgi:hypothetical protein